MRNAAVLHLSFEQLKERLGIPEGVRLVAIVQDNNDILTQAVSFLVEHESLPECPEAGFPRNMTIEQVQETVNE